MTTKENYKFIKDWENKTFLTPDNDLDLFVRTDVGRSWKLGGLIALAIFLCLALILGIFGIFKTPAVLISVLIALGVGSYKAISFYFNEKGSSNEKITTTIPTGFVGVMFEIDRPLTQYVLTQGTYLHTSDRFSIAMIQCSVDSVSGEFKKIKTRAISKVKEKSEREKTLSQYGAVNLEGTFSVESLPYNLVTILGSATGRSIDDQVCKDYIEEAIRIFASKQSFFHLILNKKNKEEKLDDMRIGIIKELRDMKDVKKCIIHSSNLDIPKNKHKLDERGSYTEDEGYVEAAIIESLGVVIKKITVGMIDAMDKKTQEKAEEVNHTEMNAIMIERKLETIRAADDEMVVVGTDDNGNDILEKRYPKSTTPTDILALILGDEIGPNEAKMLQNHNHNINLNSKAEEALESIKNVGEVAAIVTKAAEDMDPETIKKATSGLFSKAKKGRKK